MIFLSSLFLRIINSYYCPHRFYLFIVTVNSDGQASVFRDQEVIHANVQLPMQWVYDNAVAVTYVHDDPCIVIAGCGKGAGVYLRHAVTLCEVKLLPYKQDVCCVCINATGTMLFFGTESGWIFVE